MTKKIGIGIITSMLLIGCSPKEEDILKKYNVNNKQELAYYFSKNSFLGTRATNLLIEHFETQINEENKEELVKIKKKLMTPKGRDMFNTIISKKLSIKLKTEEINKMLEIEDLKERLTYFMKIMKINPNDFLKDTIAKNSEEIEKFMKE